MSSEATPNSEPVIIREWGRDCNFGWRALRSASTWRVIVCRFICWATAIFIIAYLGYLETTYGHSGSSGEVNLPLVTGLLTLIVIGLWRQKRRDRKSLRHHLNGGYTEFIEFGPYGITYGVRGIHHLTVAWKFCHVRWRGQSIQLIEMTAATVVEPICDLSQTEWAQIRRWIEAAHGGNRCPTCDYDLRGSSGTTCPECGGQTKSLGFANVG